MQPDRPLLGIALMLGFCVLAPLGDALAKLLGATVPFITLLALRFTAQGLLLPPIAAATGESLRLPPRAFRLTLLRSALHVSALAMMFAALYHLELADAIAIAFVMPFILLLLGHLLLGEEVGTRRLAACAVGFAGTLMVIRPSFAEVGWPALLPVGVAITFACFILVTRQVAREAGPVALQAVSGLAAMAMLAPLCALGLALDWPALTPTIPAGTNPWLLAAMGCLGTFGHLLMTASLRFAPAATLAPMQYLEIPFATLIGWLVFHDLPDGMAAAGITVTVAAGLYIIAREHASARRPLPPAPPAA